jgi:hypothetical protein
MKEKDLERFYAIMNALSEQYLGERISEARVELFFRVLEDLSVEQIDKGVAEMLRNRFSQKFPLPAEVREYALGNRRDLALAAFLKAGQAISKVGAAGNVIFDDPVIHQVIMTYDGGWPGVCLSYDETRFKDDFLARYRALGAAMEKNPLTLAETPRYLPGSNELTNKATGWYEKTAEVDPGQYTPVRIGSGTEIEKWHAKAIEARRIEAGKAPALRGECGGRPPRPALGKAKSLGDIAGTVLPAHFENTGDTESGPRP